VTRWLSLPAEVEWYSGHRGRERPRAVVAGGERIPVAVESAAAVGPTLAGLPARRVFVVRGGRRRLRISVTGDGRATVEEEEGR
jgi:hypothetical protein